VLLTTHKTLPNEYFREQIQKHRGTSLLIGDEAHHLGSEHQQSGLLVDYDYRVGLSATPKRYFDEEGTEYLLDYFGGVVYEYTLGEAIPDFLAPYEYHPLSLSSLQRSSKNIANSPTALRKSHTMKTPMTKSGNG